MKKYIIFPLFLLLSAGCFKNDLELKERYIAVTGVELSREEMTIIRTDTRQLFATVQPGEATNKTILWSSEDPSLVSVDDEGIVTALGADEERTTRVYATSEDGEFTAVCEVTVQPYGIIVKTRDGAAVDRISLPKLERPQDIPFLWEVVAPETNSQETVWESSDPATVEVTGEGILKPLQEGDAKITISSVVQPKVVTVYQASVDITAIDRVLLSEIVDGQRVELTEINLPVNIQDTLHEATRLDHPSRKNQNWYNWNNDTGGTGTNRIIELQEEAQSRQLFVQMERPSFTKEIIVSFEPALPTSTDVIWEYLDPGNQEWVAVGDDDETDKPLKRPVRKMVDGDEYFTAEGYPVYILTLPKGGDVVPNGGWETWDYLKPETHAYVTLRVKPGDYPDPPASSYSECRIEVMDRAYSLRLETASGPVAAPRNSSQPYQGVLSDLIYQKTVNEFLNYQDFMPKMEVFLNNQWQEVPLHYFYQANDIPADERQSISLMASQTYQFRYTMPSKYVSPYAFVFASQSRLRMVNPYTYDPLTPIGEQLAFYEIADWQGITDGTFSLRTMSQSATQQPVSLVAVMFRGSEADPKEGPFTGGHYIDPDIFPWYSTNLTGHQTFWTRFYCDIVTGN